MNTIEKLKTVNTMSAEAIALIKKLQSEQHDYIVISVDGKEIIRGSAGSPFYASFEAAVESVVNIEQFKICIIL